MKGLSRNRRASLHRAVLRRPAHSPAKFATNHSRPVVHVAPVASGDTPRSTPDSALRLFPCVSCMSSCSNRGWVRTSLWTGGSGWRRVWPALASRSTCLHSCLKLCIFYRFAPLISRHCPLSSCRHTLSLYRHISVSIWMIAVYKISPDRCASFSETRHCLLSRRSPPPLRPFILCPRPDFRRSCSPARARRWRCWP